VEDGVVESIFVTRHRAVVRDGKTSCDAPFSRKWWREGSIDGALLLAGVVDREMGFVRRE
jgi:hypothetical protein